MNDHLNRRRLPLVGLVAVLLLAASSGVVVRAAGDPEPTIGEIAVVGFDPGGEGSLYACIHRALREGIGVTSALDQCQHALGLPGERGSVTDHLPASHRGQGPTTGSCTAGPVGPAASSGSNRYLDANGRDWGTYSWGGKGGDWFRYRGLTEQESLDAKREAVDRALAAESLAEKAFVEFEQAVRERDQLNGTEATPEQIQAADQKVREKREAKNDAQWNLLLLEDNAAGDPNLAGPLVAQPADEGEGCDTRLVATMRECDRTGWTSYTCQELLSRGGCADPALIYPDPSGDGVQCGAEPGEDEAEAAAAALVAYCEERVQFDPEANPCTPPTFDVLNERGRLLYDARATEGRYDICGDPRAYIAGDACAVELSVQSFGQADLGAVLLVGWEKLGGPVFLLPVDPPGDGPLPPRDPPRPT